MHDEICTCTIYPDGEHYPACPASLYQAGIQRGREEVLKLVRAVWPISPDDTAFIPTCRYCGSQRGDKTGDGFDHENSCAWMRLSKLMSPGTA